jgi:type IX secretion system PorP/SprF family membrane protein
MIGSRTYLLVGFLFFSVEYYSQDIHFSQFENAPLAINPGNAGMGKGYNRANLVYRSQYPSLGNVFSTQYASLDFPILNEAMRHKNGLLGVGISFFNDQAGDSKMGTLHAALTLSGIVTLNRQQRLSMGLQCGYMQKSFDVSNITWDNQFNGYQYDPTLPSGEMNFMEKTGFFDMSAGVAYKYFSTETNLYNIERTSFDGGIAFFHLTRGKQEFFQGQQDRLYGRLVVHATSLFTLENRPFGFRPSVLYQRQGTLSEAIIGGGINYYIKADTKYTGFVKQAYIGLDLRYRVNDSFITGIRFKFNDFEIRLSYDYTTSDLSSRINGVGGFEIGFRFTDTYGTLFNQGNKHVINSHGGNLSL